MKYLGIDFGEKNIGLAVSDKKGFLAMPLKILNNDKKIWENFEKVLREEKIEEVVFGKSLDFKGKPNSVNTLIEKFSKEFYNKFFKDRKKKDLKFNGKIYFENEIFTSIEAKWGIEKDIRRIDIKNKKGNRKSKKENNIDHKAASMILKTFLERKNRENK